MLSLHEITMGWDDQPPLLSSFSLTIQKGEIAVLQGPSGCGKSTLLSVIAGTQSPHLKVTGDIFLAGRALTGVAVENRQIGLLFQEALLFPHMSVGDNIGFGLPQGISRRIRQEQIEHALMIAGLSNFSDRDPASLSGGQKARVATMRVMLSRPDALLMDESFAALDPALRQQFGQFVADQVKAHDIPALLISHHEDDKAFATGPVIEWPASG